MRSQRLYSTPCVSVALGSHRDNVVPSWCSFGFAMGAAGSDLLRFGEHGGALQIR
jgi:hypothetical protein